MDIKVTRHISTNLEEINDKIAKLLKDPLEAFEHASIDVDAMSLLELRAFAENGGLGACVSKIDVLASTPDELMYLQGERIIVLKHLEDDMYLGYCEGVIGHFNAENVHFVELDPRVLDSLDADLDFEQSYRNSGSSYMTDESNLTLERKSRLEEALRNSLQSYSSSSDHTRHNIGKASFESIRTSSSFSQHHRVQFDSKEHSTIEPDDPYDTSALNIDYSDDEDHQRPPQPIPTPTASTSSRLNRNIPQRASRPHQQTKKQKENNKEPTKDESESSHLRVDEYGFILQPDQLAATSRLSMRSHLSGKSMKEYREAELKWLSIVNKLDASSIKRDAKMKKMVRSSGIPASVRARVWPFLAGSSIKKGQFQQLLNKPHIPIYDVIERDITRCYPDHSQFVDANGQGQRDLRAVLTAYAQYNKQLEYCQGMGRLAGLMLMHMAVEDSFWLLVATIDRYMNGYFTPTLSQLHADAYIIGQLLKDHNPRLAQHLESNDVTPIMYIAQWFLTSFTLTLPWESVLRVWDAFYFEGIKVFYRVSLAIMDLCKDYLLQSCPTNAEILTFLLHIPHKYLQPDTLLDTAFRIKLSKTDIKRYAKKAGSEDGSLEDSIKNLGISGNSKNQVFKGLGDKIIRKSGSSINMKEQDS